MISQRHAHYLLLRGIAVNGFHADGYCELRLMLIRIDDHSLVDDLCDHYRRSGFEAEPVGGGMAEVSRPDAPNNDQGRREVLMHLQVWKVIHPDVAVETSA